MNARQRALDTFLYEMDDYIFNLVEGGMSRKEAIDYALSEYDDYWRALFEEELEKEDLRAK